MNKVIVNIIRLISFSVLFFIVSCAEKENTSFVLNAQLDKSLNDSILIKDITSYLDSSYTVVPSNGKFTFSRNLKGLRIYDVYYNGNSEVFTVFADSATVVDVSVIDSIGFINVSGGSVENKLLSDFRTSVFKEMNLDGNSSCFYRNDLPDTENKDSVIQANARKIHSMALDFIRDHRTNYASTIVFRDYLWNSPKPDYLMMDSVLQLMNGVLHDLPFIQKAKERINKKKQVMPGRYVYSIPMDCVGGRKIQTYEQRDNYLFIEFWASWSAESLRFRDELIPVYNKYKNKVKTVGRNKRKVLFVGVSFDTDTVQCKISTFGHDVEWPQVCDRHSWASDFAVKYSVTSLPDNVLLAPNNKIIAKGISVSELDSILNVELNGK